MASFKISMTHNDRNMSKFKRYMGQLSAGVDQRFDRSIPANMPNTER